MFFYFLEAQGNFKEVGGLFPPSYEGTVWKKDFISYMKLFLFVRPGLSFDNYLEDHLDPTLQQQELNIALENGIFSKNLIPNFTSTFDSVHHSFLIFDSMQQFIEWVNRFKVTDSEMIADWKSWLEYKNLKVVEKIYDGNQFVLSDHTIFPQ